MLEVCKWRRITSLYSKTSVFGPFTFKREAGVLKNLHSGERFLKRCVFGDRFYRIRVDGGPNRKKKISVFKQKINPDMCGRGLEIWSVHVVFYPGPRGFSWNFSSRKRERAVVAALRLAHSFAKKNLKKNLWDQGTVVVFVQGRQSNAQSCCFSY